MLPCWNDCAYRREVPGSAHIRCAFAWKKASPDIQARFPERPADRPGAAEWFIFPLNYDPVWGPDECAAHATEANPEMLHQLSPIEELFSILGRRAL